MTIDIYNLFIDRKYKDIYRIVKKNKKLLNIEINDNKTIIHYLIQLNRSKLLNKFIKLDIDCLSYVDKNNSMYPIYSLELGLYNTFFNLINILIKLNNLKIFELNNYNINNIILNKRNIELLKKYIKYYNNYIIWYDDKISYLPNIIKIFYNDMSNVINIISNIIKQNNFNLEKFFKLPEYSNESDNFKINTGLSVLINYYKLNSSPELKINIKSQDIKKFILLYPEQINYSDINDKTVIYYIADINDIELLDFCIKNNANINHISFDGEIIFCHYVMYNCNENFIRYILKTNINVNILNVFNETPIFELLRNTNIKDLKIITDLLNKTNDWDLQNTYGYTIIHILCTMDYIEDLYTCLKSRYFNINIKSRGGTPIDILKTTFEDLKYKDIDYRIKKFKMLVIKNFYKEFILTKKVNIPYINKYCNNKKIPSKSCINYMLKIINKNSLTNKDYLDNIYNRIIINNYPKSYYSIYNARLEDIYMYLIIILYKYNNLTIPFHENFDIKRIFEISNINELYDIKKNNIINLISEDKEIITNYQDINSLFYKLQNSCRYPIRYNTSIYLIYKYYIIPYNIIESIINNIYNNEFIIINIFIVKKISHLNILLFDIINKRIIHFEPYGGIDYILDDKLCEIFKKSEYFKNFKYYKPSDYMPKIGFQAMAQELNNYHIKFGDIGGFCVAWCYWFVEFYIQNLLIIKEDNNFINIVYKTIKKIINSNLLLSEFIRNYANILHLNLKNMILEKVSGNPYNMIYDYSIFNESYKILNKFINDNLYNIINENIN